MLSFTFFTEKIFTLLTIVFGSYILTFIFTWSTDFAFQTSIIFVRLSVHKFSYIVGGDQYFWWLVIEAKKSWWFGDSKKVWWWWFTSKKCGDLVILAIKSWWFGDFSHINLTFCWITFRISTFYQNGEKHCQIDGLPPILKEFSP